MELFDLVRCGGFVVPVRDGRHLVQDKDDPLCGRFVTDHGRTVLQEVRYRGERLQKTYHAYVERPFRGVIVGYRDILLRAVLLADVEETDGPLVPRVSRVEEEYAHCAVVYYANCRKHYVPVEHILEVEKRA